MTFKERVPGHSAFWRKYCHNYRARTYDTRTINWINEPTAFEINPQQGLSPETHTNQERIWENARSISCLSGVFFEGNFSSD